MCSLRVTQDLSLPQLPCDYIDIIYFETGQALATLGFAGSFPSSRRLRLEISFQFPLMKPTKRSSFQFNLVQPQINTPTRTSPRRFAFPKAVSFLLHPTKSAPHPHAKFLINFPPAPQPKEEDGKQEGKTIPSRYIHGQT